MTEYSPWPGTLRSNTLEVTDEPWTKNKTGREGSPGLGAPSRLRYIHSGTSPFFAQYSPLQISPSGTAACAPCTDVASASTLATRPSPAPLMTVRRARCGSRSVMVSSLPPRTLSRCSCCHSLAERRSARKQDGATQPPHEFVNVLAPEGAPCRRNPV